MPALIITEANFENEVENSNLPVLLDFWASWSPPANSSARVADNVSAELEGRIKVGTVNVNDEPDIAYKYKIRRIPTMILLKNGKVTDTIVGNLSKNQILGILN